MVRLVTVIGHGTKLLPHFIKHYKQYVDEINIVVYESDIHPLLGNEVKKIVEDYDDVNVVKVHTDRVFDWERVTMLYNFFTNRKPNDWWVIADIDEFHLYPNDDLNRLLSDCDNQGCDIVRGGFIDRIGRGGEFTELVDDTSIWEQFPNGGFFRFPMSGANPNKICLMKGYIELTSGQHYANINGNTTWKWQGWNHPLILQDNTVQVHHFKWDKTSIDRVKAVASVNQKYAYSDEYSKMFIELNKSKFKINLDKSDYMFELGLIHPEFNLYKKWNKLINKIKSI